MFFPWYFFFKHQYFWVTLISHWFECPAVLEEFRNSERNTLKVLLSNHDALKKKGRKKKHRFLSLSIYTWHHLKLHVISTWISISYHLILLRSTCQEDEKWGITVETCPTSQGIRCEWYQALSPSPQPARQCHQADCCCRYTQPQKSCRVTPKGWGEGCAVGVHKLSERIVKSLYCCTSHKGDGAL